MWHFCNCVNKFSETLIGITLFWFLSARKIFQQNSGEGCMNNTIKQAAFYHTKFYRFKLVVNTETDINLVTNINLEIDC